MSQFTLPEDALTRIGAQLNLNGTFNHTVRSAWGGHQVMFSLRVERGLADIHCVVEMGGERHSITVASTDPKRHILVADFIDAIANGRIDSGAMAPARVTRHPLLPEPIPLLDSAQEAALRQLVRKGGTLDLDLGLQHPIRIAIHRNHPRPGQNGITTILSIGETKPRTVLWTSRESDARIYARLADTVEALATAATPATARAA